MSDFDEAICVTPASEAGTYDARLLQEWCIGQVPHGGYLVAVLLNALKLHSKAQHGKLGQLDPIQLSVAFVIKAQVGIARVVVKDLKIGRTYSNYQLALQQREDNGSWITLIHAFGILGTYEKESGPVVVTTPRPLPLREECIEYPAPYPEFRRVGNNFLYWVPVTHTNPATEKQWLTFKPLGNASQRPMDDLAMGLISDLMTPLPLRVCPDERGWYPTLSLDLQFKKAPKLGGLFTYLEVESESILNGRFDITTRCYDENKDLIVISRHAAMMVSAARNTSKRSARSSKV